MLSLRALASLLASLSALSALPAAAAEPASRVAVSPIYSQLLAHSLPGGFQVAYENDSGPEYIREAVPLGQTVQKWTQMITVTGAKGLAANPDATPRRFVEVMAAGFKKACPDTFAAQLVHEGNLPSGQPAVTAWMACGATGDAPDPLRSEAALVTAIQGAADIYSVQWSMRGAASKTAPQFDDAVWGPRFKALMPIRVCNLVKGEKAPYPSCTNPR
ncbi:hypothetical protein [Hydrogenophaga sp.]|uniref:hypothetical protein n=1 Tax=Hydrogenophaga sp. TaxID=1904254 RepID=UPI0035AF38DF